MLFVNVKDCRRQHINKCNRCNTDVLIYGQGQVGIEITSSMLRIVGGSTLTNVIDSNVSIYGQGQVGIEITLASAGDLRFRVAISTVTATADRCCYCWLSSV